MCMLIIESVNLVNEIILGFYFAGTSGRENPRPAGWSETGRLEAASGTCESCHIK